MDEVLPALRHVQRACREGQYAAGFVAYEAAPAFDPVLVTRPAQGSLPLVWFGLFRHPVLSASGPLPDSRSGTASQDANEPGMAPELRWEPNLSQADYNAAIRTIRDAIADGETYQVNYTFRMKAKGLNSAWDWFRTCLDSPAPPYAACLELGHFGIASLSPELFFRFDGNRVETRPMKGTYPRGRTNAEDEAHIQALRKSEKNRAENVMIVDLLRNDLGRIAKAGTVQVDSLFDVEVYPTALQMTSTVSAQVRPGVSWFDILAALFPCGSVTGAPKAQTMAHIAQLETEPRGVYCGTMGYITPGGQAIFNVAIRTLVVDYEHDVAVYGTGGGITWDSGAEEEYQEALLKTEAVLRPRPPFQLLETLRLVDGRFHLLAEHMERLLDSAHYFRFRLDARRVQERLQEVAATHPTGSWRVRLLADREGRLTTEATPLSLIPEGEAQPVRWAKSPVDSHNPFLFHKTTLRTVYDHHRREAGDVFDVLLWNEREEATEFTIGNLVAEIRGHLYTPPCSCGLLDGTLRRWLIRQGRILERSLSKVDVERAERLWLVNSVRGFVPVKLQPGEAPS
ncbi:MAG: aminodeoxychorismate synthase component I [Alicyclobacillus herbarius]|uniref:aminodeoxychorismate synthase component I n=1 Tax=Alicyclobacillus herbarius TaxID=122960 RepID=UPI002353010B|nr:aminodeoxychorismate synthase component I [Alicyclobacillus herbarius]MCL6633120.1 aminodeoxychorismate synthase component I [Alicyclobacillus herbarius]